MNRYPLSNQSQYQYSSGDSQSARRRPPRPPPPLLLPLPLPGRAEGGLEASMMSSTRVSSDFLACWPGVSRPTTSSSANISSVTAFRRACHAERAAFAIFSSSFTFDCSSSLFRRSSSSFSFSSRARFRRKDRAADSRVSLAATRGEANKGSSSHGDGGLRPRSGQYGKLSISSTLALAVCAREARVLLQPLLVFGS